METHVQITGLQYACKEAEIPVVMTTLEKQKPEVLLVTEQTHDFGIIVRALIGTTFRGVVSRFDLENVLSMMQCGNTSVLVGQVADTDPEGRCYNICISGDYPTADKTAGCTLCRWDEWRWTGTPLLDCCPDDRRLDISLKVALAELRLGRSMNKQTLLEHLDIILQLARWDVSQETQQQLNHIRLLAGQHTDSEVRSFAPRLRHTLTALGSKKRIKEFQDTFLPMLCQSKEAEQMYCLWSSMHKAELSDIRLWQPTITSQLEAIEDCLKQLPADLCYQKDQFGALMHRLLYLNIPRCKLMMLLSALVMRQKLQKLLGLSDDEAERQLTLQLAPIFYGDTERVRKFLLLARGQKGADITSLVSRWVRDSHICAALCHRPLWTILHDAGIYKATESNWNIQLNIRKSWG